MVYDPKKIESKWQKYWKDKDVFRTRNDSDKPKYYVLDMFPYPSGQGLHVGHVVGYTATDIVSRYKRMMGFEVLHPMGWDSFGLPAEQYAIESGIHPAGSTRDNIKTFKRQCDALALSYDWERELETCDPKYYKWTQWIFLKMLEKDLAYRSEAMVNWCPALGTVLANDEVIDGFSERGGHPVIRKPMMQWLLRITAYADRLLEGLDRIDFPESIKKMQSDRIGRSEGADIIFKVAGQDLEFVVFTTRPDTLFGATFCVLAPEHEWVDRLTTPQQRAEVEAYKREVAAKSDIARSGPDAGKTGIFTGSHAINPATNEKIPIWIADYVLLTYGTGAIMCVPGHDQRDWEFAKRFSLPIREVITGGDVSEGAWEGDGTLINSGFLNELPVSEAIERMNQWLEDKGLGSKRIRYKMRDWIFARQRYWGEPVPVVHDNAGKIHPLPEDELPLLLPRLDDFQPSGSGEAPLERLPDWVSTVVPGTDIPARRETHTMPTLAASSWYFLRFIDPHNDGAPCDYELAKQWLPIDLYIGGSEHAVGHLLYARFFTKFLYDIGMCPVDEPFVKLINPGMILGEDHQKMSKRYHNVVNPTDVISQHGADALRLYEMFMGPIEVSKPWDPSAIMGVRRFLERVWRLFFDEKDELHASIVDGEPTEDTNRLIHKTIKKVRDDTENLRFNTAIAQMMTFVNEISREKLRPREVMESFVLLLAPYAPHIAEEIWQRLGHGETLAYEPFPAYRAELARDRKFHIGIQVNGRVCAELEIDESFTEDEILEMALALDKVRRRIDNKPLKKTIYVPKRLLSINC
jgi:leucyl-tRNA synthetase